MRLANILNLEPLAKFSPETTCLDSEADGNVASHRSGKIIAYGEVDTERGSARVTQSL